MRLTPFHSHPGELGRHPQMQKKPWGQKLETETVMFK